MGRPLAKRYFGNTNAGGVGGQGLLSVALGTAGTLYSQGLTATASAPQIIGGVTALVTPVVTAGTGAIASYTVTNPGSGYTTAPTFTLVKPTAATGTGAVATSATLVFTGVANTIYVGMQISGSGATNQNVLSVAMVGTTATVVISASITTSATTYTFTDNGSTGVAGLGTLTTSLLPAIRANAITVGVTPRVNSDIVKQTNTRSYKITNTDGTAICTLVTATPTVAGTMAINATDSAGGTYWVTKLTKHRVTLTPNTGTQFVANASASWGNSVGDITAVAVINVSVILDQN